jgi:hypothetical protein
MNKATLTEKKKEGMFFNFKTLFAQKPGFRLQKTTAGSVIFQRGAVVKKFLRP